MVIPDFLPAEVVTALAAEVQQLWSAGQLRTASIGQGSANQIREDVRNDHIQWLDEHNPSVAQACYWQAMHTLRQSLNEELYLGLVSLEAHFAMYPPGAFYRRHLDRFAQTSDRMLSCSLYLNADWQAEDGGQLRLYVDEGHTDVLPVAGTLAVFRSDTVYHEVLPATSNDVGPVAAVS